jgi:hypothetical protein
MQKWQDQKVDKTRRLISRVSRPGPTRNSPRNGERRQRQGYSTSAKRAKTSNCKIRSHLVPRQKSRSGPSVACQALRNTPRRSMMSLKRCRLSRRIGTTPRNASPGRPRFRTCCRVSRSALPFERGESMSLSPIRVHPPSIDDRLVRQRSWCRHLRARLIERLAFEPLLDGQEQLPPAEREEMQRYRAHFMRDMPEGDIARARRNIESDPGAGSPGLTIPIAVA